MSLALAFWILMLVWLVFFLWSSLAERPNFKASGGSLLLFILLLLLGWKTFGPPLHQ